MISVYKIESSYVTIRKHRGAPAPGAPMVPTPMSGRLSPLPVVAIDLYLSIIVLSILYAMYVIYVDHLLYYYIQHMTSVTVYFPFFCYQFKVHSHKHCMCLLFACEHVHSAYQNESLCSK